MLLTLSAGGVTAKTVLGRLNVMNVTKKINSVVIQSEWQQHIKAII